MGDSMSIVLQSTSGGSVTINEPTTASNFTQTLPAATGTVMVSGNMPAFSAYSTTNQTFTNNVALKITFDTEVFDTNSNFASSRFTPTVAGYYQIDYSVYYNLNLCSQLTAGIWKNGARFLDSQNYYNGGSTITLGSNVQLVGTGLIYLNGTTDYLEIYATLSIGGGSATTIGQSYITWFQGALVRAA